LKKILFSDDPEGACGAPSLVRQVSFRFYAELNDFLPPGRRNGEFRLSFQGEQSVKHWIESLGVPHTEVDLVLVNGQSVDFQHRVQDGDRISVFPMFEAFDVSRTTRVRPKPLRQTRFVLDVHLGRLAAYLRMLGFDSLYRAESTDEELSRISSEERRILLTRDRGLLKRSAVTHGYYVRESNARAQLLAVLRRFDLARSVVPFGRCLVCNSPLEPVSKEQVGQKVPPRSRASCHEFWECTGCRRVYWSGSHHRRMRQFIEAVIAEALRPAPPPPAEDGPLSEVRSPASKSEGETS
jgi:uncharacterized protein with PIN domain/sulfur carrier protein ThiS